MSGDRVVFVARDLHWVVFPLKIPSTTLFLCRHITNMPRKSTSKYPTNMPRRSTSKHTKRTSRRSRRSKRASRKVSPRKRRTYRAGSSTPPEAKFKVGQPVFFSEHRNFGNFSEKSESFYVPAVTENVPVIIKRVEWIPASDKLPGGRSYWRYAIQLKNGEIKTWIGESDLTDASKAADADTMQPRLPPRVTNPPGGDFYKDPLITVKSVSAKKYYGEKEGASEPNTHVRPLSEPAQMLEKSKQFINQFIGNDVVANDKQQYRLTSMKCLEFYATNNQTDEQAIVRICSDGTVVASMDTEANLPPKKRKI